MLEVWFTRTGCPRSFPVWTRPSVARSRRKLQAQTRRFLIVADQQQIAGQRKGIPSLGAEHPEASEFIGRVRLRAQKDKFARFGHEQIEIAHEQPLPVTVT